MTRGFRTSEATKERRGLTEDVHDRSSAMKKEAWIKATRSWKKRRMFSEKESDSSKKKERKLIKFLLSLKLLNIGGWASPKDNMSRKSRGSYCMKRHVGPLNRYVQNWRRNGSFLPLQPNGRRWKKRGKLWIPIFRSLRPTAFVVEHMFGIGKPLLRKEAQKAKQKNLRRAKESKWILSS